LQFVSKLFRIDCKRVGVYSCLTLIQYFHKFTRFPDLIFAYDSLTVAH